MIVRQLLHTRPVVAPSSFVACGGKKAAVVVDANTSRSWSPIIAGGRTLQLHAATIEVVQDRDPR